MEERIIKEHPILFSGPLVRAILSGEKTQTRRLVQLPEGYDLAQNATVSPRQGVWWEVRCEPWATVVVRCPFGRPGDRLWVRETWAWDDSQPTVHHALHRATWECKRDAPGVPCEHGPARWRPSIHMPRWASRLSLEVTEVRVQRLQEISEEEARAEGIHEHPAAKIMLDAKSTHVGAFLMAWNAINGKRPGASWEANPWVWAVSFKRVQG